MRSLPERKRELVEELVERSRALLPDDTDWTTVEPFVRQCYDDVGLDDLRRLGVDGLGHVARSLLGRIRCRPSDEVSIHIYNPSEEGFAWASQRTVIEVVTDDMPFLVDSLTGQLARRDLALHLAVHPQIAVRRDEDGNLLDLLPRGTTGGDGVTQESVMHYQIDHVASQADRVELETALRHVLADVKSAVNEWHPMRDACRRAIGRLRRHPPEGITDFWEVLEFLEWVGDDHFTFLGTMEYDLVEEEGEEYLRPDATTALGLLRGVPLSERAHAQQPIPTGVSEFLRSDRLLEIGKTDRLSTVHRTVHMDMISVKRFGDDGEVDGEIRFLGLFTSMAYSIAARNIPMVRHKVDRVIGRTGFLPKSHNAKMMRHIVENYPRDELFQISEEDLYLFAMRILELQLRPRPALLIRRGDEGRFVTCMVYVPRDRHNTTVRRQIRRLLEEAFIGAVTAYSTRISERPLAQMLFTVQTRQDDLPTPDIEELEKRLADAIKTWPEHLGHKLEATSGEAAGRELFLRYNSAFPNAYQQYFDADDAVADIAVVEDVLTSGELGLRLYRRQGATASRFHLRTFERSEPRHLSSFLPVLENMGVVVISEIPFEIRPEGAVHPVWIRDFEVKATTAVDLDAVAEAFCEALRRVYRGDVENDGFNRLVLGAGLDWRQIVILRAYCRYLRQTGIAFSQQYMEQTLAQNAEVGRHLLELFAELFDPSRQDGVDREQLLLGEIHQGLDQVTSLDEDRILRRFLNLIQSTLRTNFYRCNVDGQPRSFVSFKLDARNITG
ncbi:MAG: NAD-glutamate dehydrogenase domain-containing protein, partial [Acidobacteriota bacterium]